MKNMKTFILLKDLPTIPKGRVIKLSNNEMFGQPILMDIENKGAMKYVFPIDILRNNPDWFQEFEYNNRSNIEFLES